MDADLSKYLDRMSHEWIMRFVQHRVADQRILRLIQKWLKAGVLEEGQWEGTETGTPQGAVMVSGPPVGACFASISPLLANVICTKSLTCGWKHGDEK